jgi:2-polyprenyl-3-methyl-5-hydroxy-6-metoxy-1,4-benzoquinol methylase
MDQKEIRRYLNVIKRAVSFIEGMLDNDDGGLLEKLAENQNFPAQQIEPAQQPINPVVANAEPHSPVPHVNPEQEKMILAARKKHIESLMAIDCWPEAVPQFLVAKDASAEDQMNRANAVLDMLLDRPVENLSFLDFGCGDGWIVQEIIKRGVSEAIGYDIKPNANWENLQNVSFTQNFAELKNNHYDVIFLYDVLDHCEDPLFIMDQIKKLIKPSGTVYVRCHPWTSKHATHLYKQGINKAYLHLFLSYNEIKELISQEPMFTRNEKNPIKAYHWWFHDFLIKKERLVKEPVSDFFYVPAFKELVANEQQIPLEEMDQFVKQFEVQFIDYCLSPKP